MSYLTSAGWAGPCADLVQQPYIIPVYNMLTSAGSCSGGHARLLSYISQEHHHLLYNSAALNEEEQG